ncbi:MAG: hypothetical protein GY799_09185, partial [Desulfobulbaceae bacterium]|nr:hypothetical protein [Desulfobulbaceae bacterium]
MGKKIQLLFIFGVYFLLFGASNGFAHHYNITVDALNAVQVAEGGTLTFTVSLDQVPLDGDIIEVDYTISDGTATIADNDYTAIPDGTLVFDGASATSQSFDVITNSDQVVEADQTILVNYNVTRIVGTSPPITTNVDSNSTNGTIVNNDYSVLAFADITVAEDVGNAQLTVQLDRTVVGSDVTFTVGHIAGTASAGGVDYTAPPVSLTISAGADSGTIDIPIANDAVYEATEAFVVTITPSSGNVTAADPNATVNITDDDYTVNSFADITVA